ncbi:discoidin domain-containing protein [Chitinophaga sp. CF418]|uniref:discoidin domain-containing protein n=1 Tax=Chitinophaga sp. CF418 TaxID=1855287 RepID=UPI00091164AC|nr:discoidin domain-containing protein [Chitinophaga sp. CF418]SHN40864.1 alpha-L-fucosidase [Chitinophaga sp. CF418]
MKKVFLLLVLLGVQGHALGQSAPKPYGALPTDAQLKWHEMEMYCLIHFGVNTYLDHEWGYGDEDPGLVNPTQFDAKQIVGAAKAGGFKGIIVVAKHHDGLCLWPTKTTPHNISKSKWKNGKGDILKEYQLACEQLGLKYGLYCSPWDRNNPGYGKPEYLEIYRNQLRELYSNYGPLFTSWHDGANGGSGYYGGANETRNIDRTTYYDWDGTWAITRKMQPDAVLFGDVGPDVRWVGNEEGHAGKTCWATYTPQAPDPGRKPANGYAKTELATEGTRNGLYWMPAECDVPLRPGWFYHASQNPQVKTPSELLDLYYESVGRGAGLDLGLSPDQRGLLNSTDVVSLKGFGQLLRQTFAVNLAKGAQLKASNIRGNNKASFGPQFLLDNDRYSYWATDDSVTTPTLEFNLGTLKTFNVIRLRENIKLGQRIDAVAIDVFEKGEWQEIATATSIGANRLIRLEKNITTDKVRLRITGAPVCVALSDFGLYREPVHIKAPVISRDKSGMVTIASDTSQLPVYYTLDGTEPSAKSPVYKGPFLFADGGTIKARILGKQIAGDVSTRIFGIGKKGWKVVEAPEGSHADNVIDEDESTNWSTLTPELSGKLPVDVTIDMGAQRSIKAFTYLPRQDKKNEGLIGHYAFYISNNGKDWGKAREGDFHNIEANPVQQLVLLPKALHARYFRFSALHINTGKGVSVAELGIISK